MRADVISLKDEYNGMGIFFMDSQYMLLNEMQKKLGIFAM